MNDEVIVKRFTRHLRFRKHITIELVPRSAEATCTRKNAVRHSAHEIMVISTHLQKKHQCQFLR